VASSGVQIRQKIAADQEWVDRLLAGYWGSTRIVVHGREFDAAALPALIAGDHDGLATFEIERGRGAAELVTLNAVEPGRGIGSALIRALVLRLVADRVGALRLTTTNDKLAALRFYQRRGFRIVAVRPGAVDEARRTKPAIPAIGDHGIPMRDELELRLDLADPVALALLA